MSLDNWSKILSIPAGMYHEPMKWITYPISGMDPSFSGEHQLEYAQGLVAELRKLLEELYKLEGIDDWSRLALKDEIQAIRSGDTKYWWSVLRIIKNLHSNPLNSPSPIPGNQSPIDVTGAVSPAYTDDSNSNFGDVSTMLPGSNGATMNHGYQFTTLPPPPEYGYYPTADGGFMPGAMSEFGIPYCAPPPGYPAPPYPYGVPQLQPTYQLDNSYYSPHSNYSSVTSPGQPSSPGEAYYQQLSPESMDEERFLEPEYATPTASMLNSIRREIESVQKDIQLWNLEAENKERNLDGLRNLDNNFLNSIESKSSRVVSQLLQMQTQEALKVMEEFVGQLLVVTKQPDRVIQYKERFSTTVRLLLGKDVVATSAKANTVALKVINEEHKEPLEKGLGGIPEGKLERAGNGLAAELLPTIPKNPKRLNKANNPEILRVHDESFFLQYTAKVKLQNYGKVLTASTYSHPVKITVNSKQDANAWETIIWDNAANRFGIVPCRSRPQSLPFREVVNAVNAYFRDTEHGLGLPDYEVVFGLLNPRYGPRFASDNGQEHITLSQFRVEQEVAGLNLDLKDTKKISYWGWFFYLKKFVTNYVRDLFRDGAMMGYLTQEESRKELAQQADGTFLIRFSNSSPNAVTIEWCDPGSSDKKPGIYSYRGSATDLVLRSLKDRIMDSSRWTIHYPSKLPKEAMVEKFPYGFGAAAERRHTDNGHDAEDLPRLVGYVRAFLQAKLDFN